MISRTVRMLVLAAGVFVPAAMPLADDTAPPAAAQSASPQPTAPQSTDLQSTPPLSANTGSTMDVNQLFATTCGWCHSDAGRSAGRGPQLMGTQRSDDFIRFRIKHGKEGAMPAFGTTFSDADVDKIITYIRGLKPE